MCWKDVNDPPKTEEGLWSKGVITISSHGRVQEIAYFGNKEDGCWQRPGRMIPGEVIEKWIEKPKGY